MKGKTTLKIKNLVLTMMLCCISSLSHAQLATGDIAFVGVNSDPNPNELAILTLSPIASGQTILITDYPWNGTALSTVNTAAEGVITWTTNKIVPAGTLIKFTINVGAVIGGGLSAFGSVTATGWSGDAIASGGDNWFVMQGSIAAPSFIYAYANWSTGTYGVKTWLTTGPVNATVSYLPSSLSNGTTANIQSGSLLYHFDNNVYTGIKTGTKAAILAAIANSTSWSGSEVDTEIKDLSPGGTNFPGTNPIFTVGSPASVSTHPSSTSVCSNTNASFSIVASNATGYQWQVDQGQEAGFVNVSNTAPYSGATTATLTLTNVTNAMSGYSYRCVAIGAENATSNSAILTVKATTTVTDTQVACDSYKWIDDITYTASNTTATFNRTNAAGCNEVVTLNLTINKSTAVTDTQVACDSYKWIDDITYTASNTTATFNRTNAAGCNEVVTLNLTINKSTAVTDTQVACDSYKWIDDITYTASNNTATFTRLNAAGCNEVVTLNLTINKSTAVTDTQVACDSYKWIDDITYTASNNTATYTRLNAAGCDEVVTLNLTINTTASPTGAYSQEALITGTLADLVVVGNNIQWYDSSSGGLSLPLSTVVVRGQKYYASQKDNNCESNTRLEVEVSAVLKNSEFEKEAYSFYPNPVEDLFFIKSKEFIKTIKVYNSLGQEVLSRKVDGHDISVDISSFPKGVFYASVISENNIKSIKILKK